LRQNLANSNRSVTNECFHAFEGRPQEGRRNPLKNVEHHVEEEEDEMFSKARKALTEEEIETLGTRMEAAKKKQKAAISG
jgi:hypothetical protein